MSKTREAPQAVSLLLTLVVVFSLFRYVHDLAKLLFQAPFIDFAHYYTYATVVRHGLDPFDSQAVASVDAVLKIRRAGAAANYPPLFYLLMQPWTLLPFRPAAVTWFLTSQALLLAALGFCRRAFASASPVHVAAALFVVLNYQPLIENLALGQTNLLLFFLVTLAWWGLRDGHAWIVAGAVAMTPFVKPQYGLLLPLLFWMGEWRAAARALVLIGLAVGAGLLILGPAHHHNYLRYLLSPPEYLSWWTANLSPLATLHRLFGASGGGRLLAAALTLALDAVLLVVFARAIPRPTPGGSPATDWAWGLGLTAIPLLSPLTEEHHLVVLLLPLTLLLLADHEIPRPKKDRALLLGAILLLASRYSFERFPAFHQGPLTLLATGKILGVAALAWTLVRRMHLARGGDG